MNINLQFEEYKPLIPVWKRPPRCDSCMYLHTIHGFRCTVPPLPAAPRSIRTCQRGRTVDMTMCDAYRKKDEEED